jgi:hypothetical protein
MLSRSSRLVGHKDGRLAALHNMLGPAHRMRRVCLDHLTSDQPIEEHAHGRQVLFDGRLGE